MPFPTNEEVRAAVEKQLHDGLAGLPGDWIAVLPSGEELQFRPGEGGSVVLDAMLPEQELDGSESEPVERTYKLRIRVELVD